MTPFFTFALAGLLTAWLAGRFTPILIQDTPNERSLHARPTPRTGGVAILLAVTVGVWMLFRESGLPWWCVGPALTTLIIAVVSLLDDLIGLSPVFRLPVHLFAAALVVLESSDISLWLSMMGILMLTWMVNLYNFMDGMDGFAGAMAVIGFAALAWAGWRAGDEAFASVALVVAAAAAGFLVFNLPPARIFMGDVGSATLGLLAGALSWQGWRLGLFPVAYPLLVFSPFIVDATVTLLRRIVRGEKFWQAHREHYYQRLVLAGWSHGRTLAAEVMLMLAAAGSAMGLLAHPDWWPLATGVWIAVYIALGCLVDRWVRTRV
ncbi:MAG: hypothetical protein D6694_08705 [Gammaproteobacteria bacterium]|nr:MAG: hypothetical protein D6694_08705 [Gammaproteobacteria bacterium]